jgi:hypothetical protein
VLIRKIMFISKRAIEALFSFLEKVRVEIL